MTVTEWLDSRIYGGAGDRWDCRAFAQFCAPYLSDAKRVVDVGAGSGRVPEFDFRGDDRAVWGVDPDPRIGANPHLTQASVGFAEALPVPDRWADAVVAAHVVEHLPDPPAAFREIARVLKPGGTFLLKTTNRWHYVALIARLLPDGLHAWSSRRPAADTFPTLYRANTPRAVGRAAAPNGLAVAAVSLVDGRPEYLRRWGAAPYAVGTLLERTLGRTPQCRPVLLMALTRT